VSGQVTVPRASAFKRIAVVSTPVADRTPGATRWRRVALIGGLLLVGSAVPLPSHRRPYFGPYGPDKLVHLVAHGVLASALVAALAGDDTSPADAVLAVAISTLYGFGTELLQEAVPGRSFERGDVAAGLFGSVIGVLGWRHLTGNAGTAR
jgi:hypothetical protein